jgi:hypothetical protein
MIFHEALQLRRACCKVMPNHFNLGKLPPSGERESMSFGANSQ